MAAALVEHDADETDEDAVNHVYDVADADASSWWRATVDGVNAPKLMAAAVALTLLSGCTAGPAPTPSWTPTPVPSYVPWPSETPTAASGDGILRAIPAPASNACRTITDSERAMVRGVALTKEGKPTAAVDLGEGWAVVAFWLFDNSRQTVVTNGERVNWLGDRWNGYFPTVGVRFQRGDEAQRAALECVTQ